MIEPVLQKLRKVSLAIIDFHRQRSQVCHKLDLASIFAKLIDVYILGCAKFKVEGNGTISSCIPIWQEYRLQNQNDLGFLRSSHLTWVIMIRETGITLTEQLW